MRLTIIPAGITAILTCCVLCATARAENSAPHYLHEAVRAKTTPVIDGRLDDPAWQNAPVWSGFMETAEKKADNQTSFMALYDDRYFYLGIKCAEPRTAAMVAEKRNGRDAAVWNDNCVEIFMDPAFTRSHYYYQLVVNSKGDFCDGHVQDKSWNPEFDLEISVTEGKEWCLEMRLPFSAFDRPLPEDKPLSPAVWGFAIARCRQTSVFERSYFGAIYGKHHQPERFGRLVFREFLVKACRAEHEKTAGALAANPDAAQNLKKELQENARRIDRLERIAAEADLPACIREYDAITAQYKNISEQYNESDWDARFEELFKK
ncbi:MAG: carbohydrate-binding family 9-like protein [Kiritimatiellae bacterium]|nr:carbohydrate-binding family 9-like protein [Kiritimatiellia bacterium]